MTNIASLLNETHRAVGRRHIAAGDAHTALMRRRYDAPIEDVWAACTDPDRLNRWFLQVSGDLRVGGTFSLAGNARGEILRCAPPRLLTVTWVYVDRPAGEVEVGRPAGEVELRLSPSADGETVLELEHAFISESVSAVILNDPETGMYGIGAGWEAPLDYLGKYLRGELPDAPATEWYEMNSQDEELAKRRGQAWAAVVAAADDEARRA